MIRWLDTEDESLHLKIKFVIATTNDSSNIYQIYITTSKILNSLKVDCNLGEKNLSSLLWLSCFGVCITDENHLRQETWEGYLTE